MSAQDPITYEEGGKYYAILKDPRSGTTYYSGAFATRRQAYRYAKKRNAELKNHLDSQRLTDAWKRNDVD